MGWEKNIVVLLLTALLCQAVGAAENEKTEGMGPPPPPAALDLAPGVSIDGASGTVTVPQERPTYYTERAWSFFVNPENRVRAAPLAMPEGGRVVTSFDINEELGREANAQIDRNVVKQYMSKLKLTRVKIISTQEQLDEANATPRDEERIGQEALTSGNVTRDHPVRVVPGSRALQTQCQAREEIRGYGEPPAGPDVSPTIQMWLVKYPSTTVVYRDGSAPRSWIKTDLTMNFRFDSHGISTFADEMPLVWNGIRFWDWSDGDLLYSDSTYETFVTKTFNYHLFYCVPGFGS